MKKHAVALLAAVAALFSLSGCNNDYATFSSPYGNFILFPDGTYSQTFLAPPAVYDRKGRSDKQERDDFFATLPNSGSWRFIGPGDGPSNGGFKVELEGVRASSSASLGDGFTTTVDAHDIKGFSRLLGKQKSKPQSSTP